MRKSSHPPHIFDNDNVESASAFIPFCAYRSKLGIFDPPIALPNSSLAICNSFKPTILDGQLCYKLDLKLKVGEGERNELMLLLDYNEDRSLQQIFKDQLVQGMESDENNLYLDSVDNENLEAKIHMNTLSQKRYFGGGAYKMTDVKKMTSNDDFLKMPFDTINCDAREFYEDCKTRKLLELCDCIPREMPGFKVPSASKIN